MIGRVVETGFRELVIGCDSRGYVALYQYEPGWEVVAILAFRSQERRHDCRRD